MPRVTVRVYEELNDHLSAGRRKRSFRVDCPPGGTVGDVLEQLGIPPEEVEIAMVDGESVESTHRLEPGNRVTLYPMFEALDVRSELRLREEPLRRLRLLVDAPLERLASLLEARGLDVVHAAEATQRQLRRRARAEQRILVTARRALVDRESISRAIVVSSESPERQRDEVLSRLDLIQADFR